MEITEQKLKMDATIQKNCRLALPYPAEHVCFFDIETTGLSPDVSSLYLIGAAWFAKEDLWLKQWFADDYISEKELLADFSAFATNFSVFAHYNGSTFDIPYLEKKYKAHGIPSPFSEKDNLDLYRMTSKKKKWFGTSNMKLATIERFLGFRRTDCFTGKDCIRLYTEFMQKKFFRDSLADKRKSQLLLHNQDDLYGTVLCSQLLYYTCHKPERLMCSITYPSADLACLILSDTIQGNFPVQLCAEQDGIRYSFHSHCLEITIPLYEGTLYHFYNDYKNYYYLPDEDMAVHKSVGIYVDPKHRQKAVAANCYTKKTGLFLPLHGKHIPGKHIPDSVPLFKQNRKGGPSFLLLETMDNTDRNLPKEPALSKDLLYGLLSHFLN